MNARPLPPRPDIERYEQQAREVLHLPLEEAQFQIALEHGFESWHDFSSHIHALPIANSPVALFESAADAVIEGDLNLLQTLLQNNSGLAKARSTRLHRATLLHYMAANGVEDYRQKSPANAPLIAAALLQAGADVDAIAFAYGISTTLTLLVSSVHPERAGVQIPLIDILLAAGASIQASLMPAIANARRSAAEALAQRGAPIDSLIVAAALGCLPRTRTLLPPSTQSEREQAFQYACMHGRTVTAAFLLENGVNPAAGANTGQTGMHWAADGGHLETIQMLIEKKVPLDVLNRYGGTVLGQAMWSSINEPKPNHAAIIKALEAANAK